MKCSICKKEEVSTCPRPLGLGGVGRVETKPICDKSYLEMLEQKEK